MWFLGSFRDSEVGGLLQLRDRWSDLSSIIQYHTIKSPPHRTVRASFNAYGSPLQPRIEKIVQDPQPFTSWVGLFGGSGLDSFLVGERGRSYPTGILQTAQCVCPWIHRIVSRESLPLRDLVSLHFPCELQDAS